MRAERLRDPAQPRSWEALPLLLEMFSSNYSSTHTQKHKNTNWRTFSSAAAKPPLGSAGSLNFRVACVCVVCGGIGKLSSFLAPLRAKHLNNVRVFKRENVISCSLVFFQSQLYKPVLIIHPQPLGAEIDLSSFPDVFFLKGSRRCCCFCLLRRRRGHSEGDPLDLEVLSIIEEP